MVILKAHNLRWIDDSLDNPEDLCAHGGIEFSVEGLYISRPEDGKWCVSAAALYLLRTLSQSHTSENPVAETLFPCCGHSMFAIEDREDCVIIGCPNGINFDVIYDKGDIVIKTSDGQIKRVRRKTWVNAVISFSDQVSDFYKSSSPKKPYDQTSKDGFEAFLGEWQRRRKQAVLLV
jgi:hypothetical protein